MSSDLSNGRTRRLLTYLRLIYGLKLNTEDVRALIWKGWGALLKNDTETAKSLFEKALDHAPGNEDVLYALKYVTDYR